MLYRVSGHQFPLDRLIESISQCLVNLSDSIRSQIFCTGFYILRRNRFDRKQISVILVHDSRRDILQLHITDEETNIVCNQALSAFIGRHRPSRIDNYLGKVTPREMVAIEKEIFSRSKPAKEHRKLRRRNPKL